MESIHRRVVNCNSCAKVPSCIQRTAIQQSHLILNGSFSSFIFNNSMVNFTDQCQSPGNNSISALRSFISSRIFKLPNFVARGMASPVRLLHRVQVVLALLHFAISVFQEVSADSFPVTSFLMAIQAVTGFNVLVRRPVTGFVTGLHVLVHSYSHFVLLLDTY